MNDERIHEIAKKATQYIESFFKNLPATDKNFFPPILNLNGVWDAEIYTRNVLGFFYLTEREQSRIREYRQKGWPPFPGFLIDDEQKEQRVPAAIKVDGVCNSFISNRTKDLIAFHVGPKSSFIVEDHYHEIKDSSGPEFRYMIDFALIFGLQKQEKWSSLKPRLSDLLNHSLALRRGLDDTAQPAVDR
jgi:hypothetical protein